MEKTPLKMWLAGTAPDGRPRKRTLGPWLLPLLRMLAKARVVRGRWFDPFRYSHEREVDRSLLADYENDLDVLLAHRPPSETAHALANWPAEVRGYGPVREAAIPAAQKRRNDARAALIE